MKIAWLRYPQKLYSNGKVLRGGSEIANQYIIDYLRQKGVEVIDFMPESDERIGLMDLPAIGTPLMFQDLLKKIDQINACDLVVTTNWFGAILPEIKKPLLTIFHSNASLVLDSIKDENITDKKLLNKWFKIAQKYDLATPSSQSKHEMVITLGESYFAQNSQAIVAVSFLLKNSLEKYYNASKNKITVINNTYATDWQNIAIDKEFRTNNLSIINITRLPNDYNGFVGKGTDRILEIFHSFPHFSKILIAADKPGTYDQILKGQIKNVTIKENADRQTVGEELAKAHISIHCSRCEACQLTLIEAMLQQTVPITFKVGVAEELIRSGQNGFLVNNIGEMKKHIKWLNCHPVEAKSMALKAQETIKQNLSIEKIGGQYLDLIKSIITQ